jgi:hypothetical protein
LTLAFSVKRRLTRLRNNSTGAVSEPGAISSGREAHMSGLRQLGWPHYLLLVGTLGSLLAILAVALLVGSLLR